MVDKISIATHTGLAIRGHFVVTVVFQSGVTTIKRQYKKYKSSLDFWYDSICSSSKWNEITLYFRKSYIIYSYIISTACRNNRGFCTASLSVEICSQVIELDMI